MIGPAKRFFMNCCFYFCPLLNRRFKFKQILAITSAVVIILVLHFKQFMAVKTPKEVNVKLARGFAENNIVNGDVKTDVLMDKKTCTTKHNIVYIKAIKCASETLTAIFRRFGYTHNLSFVLPPNDKIYLGWPYDLQKGYYREPKTDHFNLLCEHVVYNEKYMKKLMPKDTIYLTSIRQPFAQFKSMFHYYNVAELVGIKDNEDSLVKYLADLPKYEQIYKSTKVNPKRYCIPANFSMSRNLMSYTLGFDSYIANKSRKNFKIKHWLEYLEREFELVLVVEYFEESLVLLRRILCWTWKDILYIVQNKANYTYKYMSSLEDVYKSWSVTDYALYNHFNKSLWQKISKQSTDFKTEVFSFTKTRQRVERFCDAVLKKKSKLKLHMIVPQNKWTPAFLLKWSDCFAMVNSSTILVKIKQAYDNIPVKVNQPPAPAFVC